MSNWQLDDYHLQCLTAGAVMYGVIRPTQARQLLFDLSLENAKSQQAAYPHRPIDVCGKEIDPLGVDFPFDPLKLQVAIDCWKYNSMEHDNCDIQPAWRIMNALQAVCEAQSVHWVLNESTRLRLWPVEDVNDLAITEAAA